MNFKGIIVCLYRKFDYFDHSGDWFLDDFRYRLIVQDGLREIRIDDCAKAKQDDITDKFRVISRWITDEKMFARLEH